jgi:hypothetical protein
MQVKETVSVIFLLLSQIPELNQFNKMKVLFFLTVLEFKSVVGWSVAFGLMARQDNIVGVQDGRNYSPHCGQ